MKRIFPLAILIILVSMQAAFAGVRFAPFKFQPDATYEIEIFHKNIMKFKFNDPESPDAVPLGRVIPLENQVLFKATLRTYPVTDANVMPVKMHLKNFITLIKRGKNMIPQNEAANNELKGKEFLGELDANGAIVPVGGRSESDAESGGDAGVFLLLGMIPDMPDGEYEVGSKLFMNAEGAFFSPGDGASGAAFIYTISELLGDEVHIEIADSAEQDSVVGDETESHQLGTRGKLIYSQRDGICSYVMLNTVSTSEPEKEELKSKGVTLNNRFFKITIDKVE